MTTQSTTVPKPREVESPLRLDCLPAGACYACGTQMVRSSGSKWLCRACGFVLTCCDP